MMLEKIFLKFCTVNERAFKKIKELQEARNKLETSVQRSK